MINNAAIYTASLFIYQTNINLYEYLYKYDMTNVTCQKKHLSSTHCKFEEEELLNQPTHINQAESAFTCSLCLFSVIKQLKQL